MTLKLSGISLIDKDVTVLFTMVSQMKKG